MTYVPLGEHIGIIHDIGMKHRFYLFDVRTFRGTSINKPNLMIILDQVLLNVYRWSTGLSIVGVVVAFAPFREELASTC